MSLAVVVVLLHNMIAHEHAGEMSDQEHISAHSCTVTVLDTIVLGLHVDGGEGHLEHFVASNVDFDFNFVLVDSIYATSSESIASVPSIRTGLPIYFNPSCQLFPLRGPPAA